MLISRSEALEIELMSKEDCGKDVQIIHATVVTPSEIEQLAKAVHRLA